MLGAIGKVDHSAECTFSIFCFEALQMQMQHTRQVLTQAFCFPVKKWMFNKCLSLLILNVLWLLDWGPGWGGQERRSTPRKGTKTNCLGKYQKE